MFNLHVKVENSSVSQAWDQVISVLQERLESAEGDVLKWGYKMAIKNAKGRQKGNYTGEVYVAGVCYSVR